MAPVMTASDYDKIFNDPTPPSLWQRLFLNVIDPLKPSFWWLLPCGWWHKTASCLHWISQQWLIPFCTSFLLILTCECRSIWKNLPSNKAFTPCLFFLFPSLSFLTSKWRLKACCVTLHPGSTKIQVSTFSTVVRS